MNYVKPIVAYQCDYCGTIKRTKKVMQNHELTCMKNPNAINCLKCVNAKDGKCVITSKKCSKAVSAICGKFKSK